jgi:hypothetical protein
MLLMEAVHVRNVPSECCPSGQECCNGSTCYDPDTFCGDANNKIFFQNAISAGDGPTEVRRHSEDSIPN